MFANQRFLISRARTGSIFCCPRCDFALLRDFLLLREVECADTFCNFAEVWWPESPQSAPGFWSAPKPHRKPEAQTQPALKQVVEMELLSFKVVVRSNSPPGYQPFMTEQAG